MGKEASYIFINRTKNMKLNYEAFCWLETQINGSFSPCFARLSLLSANCLALEELRVTPEELAWLRNNCAYLPDQYLQFLSSVRVYPQKQVTLEWNDHNQDISILLHGRWIDTILYEIPILALVSEAYFRFVDSDWDYVGQYGIPPAKLHVKI